MTLKTTARRELLRAYLAEFGSFLHGVSRADALGCIELCAPEWFASLSTTGRTSLNASLGRDLDAVGERTTEPGEIPIRWGVRREEDTERRVVKRLKRKKAVAS